MKVVCVIAVLSAFLACQSCNRETSSPDEPYRQEESIRFTSRSIARMFAELPIEEMQLAEVFDAVNASSGNGYDEEYMLRDVMDSPGAGVGDSPATRAVRTSAYKRPLKDLITEYFSTGKSALTKGGAADVEDCLNALRESGMQIYWPYSEDWDGVSFPLVTWDPGYGAEVNYAYETEINERGFRVVDSLLVDEAVAMHRPVWVINTNDDSSFTPADMYLKAPANAGICQGKGMRLVLKRLKMLRNYDSWFGGASEFFIKCGAVDGFSASTEAELKLYSPSVTDFMVVVKRKYKDVDLDINSLILGNFTSQISDLALLVTEDDGGTRTSWKCSATVKINSKSYGFDIDIPYNDKDDIVWRGQLPSSFFMEEDEVGARFGDLEMIFSLE